MSSLLFRSFNCNLYKSVHKCYKILCLEISRQASVSYFKKIVSHRPLTSFVYSRRCLHFYSTPASERKVNKPQSVTQTDSNDGKIFVELENEVYHAYLENCVDYSQTIHKIKTPLNEVTVSDEEFNTIVNRESWTECCAEDYFVNFIKVAEYCTLSYHRISDSIFINICNAFPSKCVHFNDEQLIRIFICLQNWPNAPSVRDENYLKVWKALDAECICRRTRWDLERTLYMIDLWYSLKLTRLSAYVMKSTLKLIDKAKRLSQQNLVQLMFYLNTVRKVPKGASVFEVEYQIAKVMNSLSVDELAIVCSGFFKSQSNIASYELIDAIVAKLIEYKDSVGSVNLASILKAIRYTYKDRNIGSVIHMLDVFSVNMNKYSLQVNIHMANVCIPKRINHRPTFNNLIEQFLLDPRKARLKDMGKIAEIISTFNITSDEAKKTCQVIVSELENKDREQEILKFHKVLIWCLCHLSFNKAFCEAVATKVLDQAFIKSVYETNYSIDDKIFQLDQNIALLCPSYKGNRLPDKLIFYLSKRYSSWVPGTFVGNQKKSRFDTFLTDFINALRILCSDNDNLWYCGHFLPHFPNPDVLIHIDKNKKFLCIPNEIRNRPLFTGLITPPHGSVNLLLFILLGNTSYTHDNKLIGDQLIKIEQLKTIGYSPVLVSYNDFLSLDATEKRVECIKDLILSS